MGGWSSSTHGRGSWVGQGVDSWTGKLSWLTDYSISGRKGPRTVVQPRGLHLPGEQHAQGPSGASGPGPLSLQQHRAFSSSSFIQRSQTFAKRVILKWKPSGSSFRKA